MDVKRIIFYRIPVDLSIDKLSEQVKQMDRIDVNTLNYPS